MTTPPRFLPAPKKKLGATCISIILRKIACNATYLLRCTIKIQPDRALRKRTARPGRFL